MGKVKNRFASEVHLGLLVIIVVLLAINIVTNYVVFKTRQVQREELNSKLTRASMSIAREWRRNYPGSITPGRCDTLKATYDLTDLIMLPAQPSDTSRETKVQWVESHLTGKSGPGVSLRVAMLLHIQPDQVSLGSGSEYVLLKQVEMGRHTGLLMVAAENRLLAYLDSAGQTTLNVSLVAGLLVLGIYLLLIRHILSPFKKLRQQAIKAGRDVDDSGDDVEAVIEEYQRIIEDLQAKEAQLVVLNKEIHQRAESLEESNKYLLRSMSSGILTVNTEGILRSINDAATQILGQEVAKAWIGEHYWDSLQESIGLVNMISRTLKCGQSQPYKEVEFTLVDGSTVFLGVSISPVADSKGQLLGASVLINDLTELVTLRRQLESNNRLAALGEMAGGLAHQLRNSLGAIMGYGKLLERRLIKNNLSASGSDALLAESLEAESLIERFLDFARPLKFSPGQVDLVALIDTILESFSVRDDCQRVRFKLTHEDATPIEADALLIKQVLANLIENGITAMDDRTGELTVNIRKDKTTMLLEIQDTGAGIKDEDLQRIFTPFYSSRPAGTGLGLPLVSKIIDLHSGRIDIFSEMGHGTTISVRLPMRQPQSESTLEPVASSHRAC